MGDRVISFAKRNPSHDSSAARTRLWRGRQAAKDNAVSDVTETSRDGQEKKRRDESRPDQNLQESNLTAEHAREGVDSSGEVLSAHDVRLGRAAQIGLLLPIAGDRPTVAGKELKRQNWEAKIGRYAQARYPQPRLGEILAVLWGGEGDQAKQAMLDKLDEAMRAEGWDDRRARPPPARRAR